MTTIDKPEPASARNRQQRLTPEHVAALQEAYAASDMARAARAAADDAIRRALAVGVSLADVGRCLGISKQAAHQRYATATARRRQVAAGDTLF